MTKPANFPERKRQRQARALERLGKRSEPARKDGETDQQFAARKPAWRAAKAAQVRALEAAVLKGSQRGVRTKKYRGSGREFQRGATA